MQVDMIGLASVGFIAAIAAWIFAARFSKFVTIAGGVVSFSLAVSLISKVSEAGSVSVGTFLYVDPLSLVFLIPTCFLYLATAIFSAGYVHPPAGYAGVRYMRNFYAGLNLFCWAMIAALVVNGLALIWIAIEITTVVSVLLVAIDRTDGASEAAWKYLLIASLGLGIGLIATIFIYAAGSHSLGSSYNLSFNVLISSASSFPPQVVRLAFVLAVIGYGTKVGFFPVHTWLPDAHSEAPTPVSALLSGSLLSVSFYAILRFFQVTEKAVGSEFPRGVLLIFGLASLGTAALYLVSQRDIKRLLGYSSIEHMGILAVGMSFAAPIAVFGVLLHVIAHALAKGGAFFGAGSILRKFQTKDMARIRGGMGLLPWSGPMFLLAVLALSAMPPFGIFRSEFLIVMGALQGHDNVAAVALVVFVTMAFFGLTYFATRTILTPTSGAASQGLKVGEPSSYIVVAMGLCLLGLVILGVHPPGQLVDLIASAARELRG